jgi:hypothetical protein
VKKSLSISRGWPTLDGRCAFHLCSVFSCTFGEILV